MRIRLLGQSLPASIVVRAAVEIALLVAVVYGAALVRFHGSVAAIERSEGPLWPRGLLFGAIMFASQLALGLHSVRQRARSEGILVRIGAAVGIGVAMTGACFFLVPDLWIGRGVVAVAGAGAGVIAVILHVVLARFVDERAFKGRVLI